MELREIQELMKCFDASGLTALELSGNGTDLRMEKAAGRTAGTTPSPAAPAGTATVPPPPPAKAAVEVKAPMVGVAYAAPGPEAEPYVRVGQRVEKGQTLCLMEAMKMMNEIPAPCAGTVTAIRFQNGQLAEFGAVLVELEETGC